MLRKNAFNYANQIGVSAIKITLIMCMSVFGLHELVGQVDNSLWSSFRIRHQLSEKTTIDFRPIFRFNDDISSYQNSSIDLVIHHKLPKGFFIRFLSRTWFLPNSPEGQFLWGDIGYQLKHEKFTYTSFMRMHLSLNTNDINPNDFIRYKGTIAPKVPWKFKPFITSGIWYQINGVNDFRRVRYEAGFSYPITKESNFAAIYRRQNSVGIDPSNDQNHFVVTVTYNL